MVQLTKQEDMSSSFSVRKIPTTQTENTFDTEDKKYSDKVKILELNNIIETWERELLFGEKGFYTLKGKAVENKTKEFISELEKFIDAKSSQMAFALPESKETAMKIKYMKIENMKYNMLNYEAKELYNWEIEVYNTSVENSIQKAVLYKNNPKIVASSFKNAMAVLGLMADREKWNSKIQKSKKDTFVSDFYYSIIKAFQDEKDIKFVLYFEKYKDKLLKGKKEELEKTVKDMKTNIIAYNWASELFSYNLTDDENEKQINSLRDEQLESAVKNYLKILKKTKKNNEENEKNQYVENNWVQIISCLEKEPYKALLYIDSTNKQSTIAAQKEYIKAFVKDGYVVTNPEKYIQLFKEMIDDFCKFKKKLLSDYRSCFSNTDYEFFIEQQKEKIINPDYGYILKLFGERKINKIQTQYEILGLLLPLIKSKDIDFEKRNKIIQAVFERYSKEQDKKEKKELKKDDSIINNSGK